MSYIKQLGSGESMSPVSEDWEIIYMTLVFSLLSTMLLTGIHSAHWVKKTKYNSGNQCGTCMGHATALSGYMR